LIFKLKKTKTLTKQKQKPKEWGQKWKEKKKQDAINLDWMVKLKKIKFL
jgi:hypothetical protein